MNRERSSSSITGAMEAIERPATGVTGARYEEVAWHRSELEAAKRENEALKRRIRELERMVRDRRSSDASATGDISGGRGRMRSESELTTASIQAARGRERDGDSVTAVVEDAVRVGESARGGGLR